MMKNRNMKARAADIFVVAQLGLPILALFALISTACAQQGNGSDLKAKDEADAKAMHQYIDRMENDQKYQEAIRNQQAPPASKDPWGAVRPTTTPAAGGKPAAKTVSGTKTASGANKAAAGSIKPAPGAATSASGATPKSQ
jgi:hypothetical protein